MTRREEKDVLRQRPRGGLTFYGLLLVTASCNPSLNSEQELSGPRKPPRLLEPVKSKQAPVRCVKGSKNREMTLRSMGRSALVGGTFVEVDSGVSLLSGYAVGVLRGGAETHALVAWFDGAGRERVVDLGRVHGSVEPPRLHPVGDSLIVAVSDSDAGNSTIRFARVVGIDDKAQVTWGPTVRRPRSESSSISLTSGTDAKSASVANTIYLVWDAFERSSLRSRVHFLAFSLQTMKVVRAEQRLSSSEEDVMDPRLLWAAGGLWLMWLKSGRFKEETGAAPVGADLVEEAPLVLQVQRLSAGGKVEGESLRLSPPSAHVFAYDATVLGNDSLFVAYRAAHSGRPVGATPIQTRLIDLDGSVVQNVLTHPALGPGLPLLLGRGLSPWLLSPGTEDDILLGLVGSKGQVLNFREEPGLERWIPLARDQDEVLVMRPVGLDLALSLVQCGNIESRQVLLGN